MFSKKLAITLAIGMTLGTLLVTAGTASADPRYLPGGRIWGVASNEPAKAAPAEATTPAVVAKDDKAVAANTPAVSGQPRFVLGRPWGYREAGNADYALTGTHDAPDPSNRQPRFILGRPWGYRD